MSRRLRIAVVGAGGIAQMMHLPTLAERPDLFEIIAIADLDRELVDAVAKRYAVPHVTTDYREIVTRSDVDAVLLCASGSHVEPGKAVLAAGKHLFVEKPLGFGREETEILARAAKEARGLTVVGYHKRYDPVYRRARTRVRNMRELRYVEVTVLHPDDGAYRMHHAVLPAAPVSTPRSAAETELVEDRLLTLRATSGPMAHLFEGIAGRDSSVAKRVASLIGFQSLIHDTNLVRGILGEPERVLSAHVWRGGLAQSSVTRFPGDVHVNMSWIAVGPLKNYEETVRFIGPDDRITLVFPSPYLRHVPTRLSIERMEGEGLVVEEHVPTYEEAFRVELYEFRNAVLGGGPGCETTVDDALGDARWIHSIIDAMA